MGVYNYTPWHMTSSQSTWWATNCGLQYDCCNQLKLVKGKRIDNFTFRWLTSFAFDSTWLRISPWRQGSYHSGLILNLKGIIWRSDGVVYTQDRAPLLPSVFLVAHVNGRHNLFDMHSNSRHKLHFSWHTTFFCAWQATSRKKCTCQLNLKINYDICYLKRLQVC